MSIEKVSAAAADSPSNRYKHLIALALILAFHLCVNLWWLQADNHPVRSDEEDHMVMARNYYQVMFMEDQGSPMKKLVAISTIPLGIPAHPPLLHILGACFIHCFGYNTDIIAATNTLLFLLTLLGCYCIARRFLDPWESVAAVFLISFIPLIFVGSRYFMTDYPALLLSVWGVYAMLQSDRFQNTGWSFFFALLVGLGILARTMTFLYIIVPAFVLWLLAILSAFSRESRADYRSLKHLALNTAIILVVSLGVCSPWYFHNLEGFHTYWTELHSGKGPLAITPLAAAPAASEAPKATKVVGPKIEAKKPPSATKKSHYVAAPGLIKQLQKPIIPWRRYPLYAVNSALFLPIFLLAMLGVVMAFLRKRFRSLDILILLLWILGSWATLTLVLKHGTARYVLPTLPAFGFFAIIAILALPGRTIRYACLGIVAVLLLFQFGNLSIHAYGPMAKAYLPVTIEKGTQRDFADPGVALYKNELCLGHAYAKLGPPEQDNFVDKIFKAMVRTEKERPFLSGEDAPYIRLNLRGLEFAEKHYWPAPNPFQHPDQSDSDLPRRRIRCVGYTRNLAELAKKLKLTEYVVYAARADDPATEKKWRDFLESQGFESVEQFSEERRNYVEARHYGVYAKRLGGDLIQIRNEQDIAALGLFDLYGFKHSPEFAKLPVKLQRFTEESFRKKLNRYQSTPIPLNEHLLFIGADVRPLDEQNYLFHFIFKVDKAIDRTWRIFVHGRVNDEDIPRLPERCREAGYQDWNFNPVPPTKDWQTGEYIIVQHQIDAVEMPYFISLGFFDNRTGEFWGSSTSLGWINFKELQEKRSAQ